MTDRPTHSVVVPLLNEQEVLSELYARLSATMQATGYDYELVFVDDGSDDDSLAILTRFAADDARIRVLSLSRNFGHQAALSAGLAHVRGDFIAILDADLQDPPALLPRLFAAVANGSDVAYGVRTERKEGALKRAAYASFYRLLRRFSAVDLPLDAGDFCAMSRRVVDALDTMPETDRYLRGLRSWVGFRQTGIPYERDSRFAGQPKYDLVRLIRLAVDGLFSFSLVPLRLIVLLGLTISLGSFIGIVTVVYLRLFTNLSIPGFAATTSMLLFLGGIQLLTLGVIGEYVGRILNQVKGRPLYLVRDTVGFRPNSRPD